MPDCPKCKTELAFGPVGGVCPKCHRIYSPGEVRAMPGYNAFEVNEVAFVFSILSSAGLLSHGVNKVEFTDDGLIIEHSEVSD